MKHKVVLFTFLVSLLAVFLPGIQHDATFLKKEISYTLNHDGSWIKDYKHLVKLETHLATRRLFGETFINYNPKYQKLEIMKSETTKKNGEKVNSPKNAFNEILPYIAHNFACFSNLRRMVITHTGLEREAIVDLHYRILTKPGFFPYFSGIENISQTVPINEMCIKISVPDSIRLKYKLFHSNVKPIEKKMGNQRVFSFKFKNVKPYVYEPNSHFEDNILKVVFSTAKDWKKVFSKTDINGELPECLIKKVKTIKSESSNLNQLLFKVQKFIASNLENCSIGPELIGYRARSLEDIYSSNFGTKLEKVFLLHKILNHLKIPAEIIGVPSGRNFSENVPTILQMNNYLIKVKKGSDKVLYINPWIKQTNLFPFEKTGQKVVNFQKSTIESISGHGSGWDQNLTSIKGRVKINKEKCTGEFHILIRGYNNSYIKSSEDIKKYLKEIMGHIMKVKKIDVKNLGTLSLLETRADVTVEGKLLKKLGDKQKQLKKFKFPFVSYEMGFLKKRQYPLILKVPFRVTVKLEIEGSKDIIPDYLTKEVSVKNDIGYYIQKAEIGKGGIIYVKQKLGIKTAVIPIEKYSLFREILINYLNPNPLVIF